MVGTARTVGGSAAVVAPAMPTSVARVASSAPAAADTRILPLVFIVSSPPVRIRCGIPGKRRPEPARAAVLQGFYVPAHELERLVAGRDRPRCALLGDQLEQPRDLRPGRDAQLVAAEKRLSRIGRARSFERGRELEGVHERE